MHAGYNENVPSQQISTEDLIAQYPLPAGLAESAPTIRLASAINDLCFQDDQSNGSSEELLPWLVKTLYENRQHFTNEHAWDALPADMQAIAMKTLAEILPTSELLAAAHYHATLQVRCWASMQLSYLDETRGLIVDTQAVRERGIAVGREPGVRAQVFEVVVRQAMAGAPWRLICAGPLQVNNISEDEVIYEVHKRKLRLIVTQKSRQDPTLTLTEYALMWRAIALNCKDALALVQNGPIDDMWQARSFQEATRVFGRAVIRSCVDKSTAASTTVAWQKRLKNATTPSATNRLAAEAAIKRWYDYWGAPQPEHILWLESPHAALSFIHSQELQHTDAVGACISSLRWAATSTLADVQRSAAAGDAVVRESSGRGGRALQTFTDGTWSIMNTASRGQLDIPLLVALERTQANSGLAVCDIILDAAQHCGFWWTFRSHAIITPKPTQVHLDDRQRPHRLDGPAIQFEPWELFFAHGVLLPPDTVLHPDRITPEQIEQQGNIEIRRVLIDLYGIQRYMRDSGAVIAHESPRGILYRKAMTNDEPIVMVKVINSTAEPDGTFKEYFLRVPPDITTVDEAVAWTFDFPVQHYAPSIET